MQNILIAGGTGFIGKSLLETFHSKGFKVSILSRQEIIPSKAFMYTWNPLAGVIPFEALANQDIIINLAGTSIAGGRWTAKRKESISNSRMLSTRLLVKTIRENKLAPKLFISASAIGYYGNRPDEDLTEESPAGTDFMSQVCKTWESELDPLNDLSIPYAILRLGLVLSQNGGIFPILIHPLNYGMNVALGTGRQYMSWIHIHDLVGCIGNLMNGKLNPGVYNCVAPGAVKQYEFNGAVQKLLKKRMVSFRISANILKIILGEMAALVTDDQHVLPTRLTAQNFRFQYPVLNDALCQLLSIGEI
jgi:hypothetical protein